jgi:flagellar motility protein MotE (MotC chaperone)
MSKSVLFVACALVLSLGLSAHAQDPKKARPDPPRPDLAAPEPDSGDDVQRYCASVGPSASEARVAWQMKRLNELEDALTKRITDLDAKESSAREWIARREDMLKKGQDDVVAIYAKMQPEAAATRLGTIDESEAAAIVAKLNPRVAAAILNEMEATKAGKITDLSSGASEAAQAAAQAAAAAAGQGGASADAPGAAPAQAGDKKS